MPDQQDGASIGPCSTHRADQEVGVTWTLTRRPHCEQYLGGSMLRARSQSA
ncbi:MAG: hypothetical protein HOV86_09055 [Thermoactinospora sp.]|nr:hypothetical protein [Thermoactinospora sp.]